LPRKFPESSQRLVWEKCGIPWHITATTAANAIGGIQVTSIVENDFEKHPSLESIRQAYQGPQFRFNEIGIGEVENELKMIKSNKATGWDGISPKISKLTAKGVAPSLTSLYNTVIRKGNWPST